MGNDEFSPPHASGEAQTPKGSDLFLQLAGFERTGSAGMLLGRQIRNPNSEPDKRAVLFVYR